MDRDAKIGIAVVGGAALAIGAWLLMQKPPDDGGGGAGGAGTGPGKDGASSERCGAGLMYSENYGTGHCIPISCGPSDIRGVQGDCVTPVITDPGGEKEYYDRRCDCYRPHGFRR